MSSVLVTGFEAFGHTPINPAERVAKELDGTVLGSARIISRVLPDVFFKCIGVVVEAFAAVRPEVVVMLGEYGGRAMITVKRLAQNMNDSTRYQLADNDGVALQGEATVPLRAMVKAMRESGIPADISDAPGTFCCNHLMYGVLHHIATNRLPVRAGWIHLPYLPGTAALIENLGAPSMSVETSVEGVKAGVRAILENTEDMREIVISRLQL